MSAEKNKYVTPGLLLFFGSLMLMDLALALCLLGLVGIVVLFTERGPEWLQGVGLIALLVLSFFEAPVCTSIALGALLIQGRAFFL